MLPSLLITQCLQNDFVKPVGRDEPLPNLLHIGHEEARRLMGENPAEGPLARMMQWAYERGDETLRLIHIRDWHDPRDPAQAGHLRQFGAHCIQGAEGARFVFEEPISTGKTVPIIDALTLNDFADTNLAEVLAPHAHASIRVGLVGVWTEAKITFLAYELRTRYPDFQIAVCSALTAGSSRSHHFLALAQLNRLLGVTVFSAIGEFLRFLGGNGAGISLALPSGSKHPEVEIEGAVRPGETDYKLARYLFRDARNVRLRCLHGGFSGNLVLKSESVDLFGHTQAPHVVKIGPEAMVAKERMAFEQIESVLGNCAPSITDFADLEDRGAIKYRYASMDGGFSVTFQKLYANGLAHAKVDRILKTVFREQLGRFYAAAVREKCDLLEYYGFSPALAPRIRARVEKLLGQAADQPALRFSNGREFPNVCLFYERTLAGLTPGRAESRYVSYIHGDLNGANIILDGRDNVWLIDFFHTRRGHVLQDLIKLENDLLYIWTPISHENEWEDALRLTDFLMKAEDLAAPLPEAGEAGLRHPHLIRACETLRLLRSFHADLVHEDRGPLQLWIGQMRYAVHTLSFDESNEWQKKWALYAAALCGARIEAALRASNH
ncbi:MAG: isochorismatase family protein [Verrucomicrobia bacterium]|nr:isochorismatase family protein [Verrucomicrobiota bacterium]